MDKRKTVAEAICCFECENLYAYGVMHRCRLYDDAIIRDASDKHCKDSIK